MIKVCIYCNRKYPDGNITFHKFPSDKERRKKWLSAMKISSENINKNSYLCSEHFEEKTYSCQLINNVLHRFLYIHAVPSIFEDKPSKISEIEAKIDENIERLELNQNSTIQVPQKCQVVEEEEDCFYYRIENGVIHRYLRGVFQIPASPLISSINQEIRSDEGKEKSEGNLNTESIEVVIEPNTVHVEAPVKVELLPDIELPIEVRNEEIYSKETSCNFKSGSFENDKEIKSIDEDIKMDTEEIALEQINEYSNLNGINEIEITTCNPISSEVDENEGTSISANFDINAKAVNLEMDIDMSEDTVEGIERKRIAKVKIEENRLIRQKYRIKDTEEEIGEKAMKTMLYQCLENKNSVDLERKLKTHTKLSLIKLLTTALNYIECLEDKLSINSEKNNQYQLQITELENLLQSISDSETSKTNSV